MKCLVKRSSFVWCAPLVAMALVTFGCSSSEPDPKPGASGGASSTGGSPSGTGHAAASAIPHREPHGGVNVDLAPASDSGAGYTTVIARFFDGPTPEASPLKLDSELGDCKLWVPDFPFCSEPCAPDACTADEECTPYPSPLGVGTLTIEGLGPVLTLQPSSTMQVYQAPSLANPACPAGAPVTASASDLQLEATCIPQLELSGPDPITVMSGQAVKVSWVAAAAEARIRIGLDVAHHGGKKGEIDCDVPDTGSFEIPEPLVTKLVGLGVAGYPTINVTRVSRAVDASRKEVQLLLSSNVVRAVDTGVKSCQESSQCPQGQACLDTKICG